MSGSNPFRRSRVVEADSSSANIFSTAAAAASPTALGNSSEEAAPSTPPKRTKKKVTIQTPPLSPESPEFIHSPDHGVIRLSASDSAARVTSPPPLVDPRSIDNSEIRSAVTATADSELDQAALNTRKNSGLMAPAVSGVEAGAGAARAPYNPFARTLATSQAGFGLQREGGGGGGILEEGNKEKEKEWRQRPALDVDVFKNILMTGAPIPASASRPPQDSSSSTTDNSSLFEPAYGLQPQSPHRDAFDDYESASEDEGDERSGLMGAGRSDDIAPPAPPKPNMKSKGPQTVSFADFDQSIPAGSSPQGPRTPPVHTQHLTGILRASSPRPNSDLNKPLPPPPPTRDIPDVSSPPVPDKDTPPQTTPAPDAASATKKPPPPPTRKAGGHGRPRSASNLSTTTQDSTIASADNATIGAGNKLAPPPPPSRRHHPSSHSAVDVPLTEPSPVLTQIRLAPAPPPRRHGSTASRSSQKPSRQTSDDSTTAQRTDITTPTGGIMPPPPPPRRERGSKRTSIDGPPSALLRRMSGEHHRATSFDSERSASISSLQKVNEDGEASAQTVTSPPAEGSRDILADMAAFEAEINALRAQSQRPK